MNINYRYTRDHMIIKEEIRGSKRSFESTTQDDTTTDNQNFNDGNYNSPKKPLRETFSGNSIQSYKSIEIEAVDENMNEESENENNTNIINDINEPVTKATALPRLTRTRSGKLGKTTR